MAKQRKYAFSAEQLEQIGALTIKPDPVVKIEKSVGSYIGSRGKKITHPVWVLTIDGVRIAGECDGDFAIRRYAVIAAANELAKRGEGGGKP